MNITRRACPFLIAILLTAGCSPAEPKPVKITGKVVLDKEPMAAGDIYFQPGDGRVPVQTKIVRGEYSLAAPPGEYRVVINQYRDSGKKNAYGDPQMESTIPQRYNVNTELKATVSADGPTEFNFEIESR
jgi:hypothetical protein